MMSGFKDKLVIKLVINILVNVVFFWYRDFLDFLDSWELLVLLEDL